MRLMDKWKAYAGPKDERIAAEANRIYKIGYLLISLGFLVALYYDMCLKQVAAVNELAPAGTAAYSGPEVLLFVWFVATDVLLIALQCRAGFVSEDRFGETDHFPSEYFALLAGLSALGTTLLAALLRTVSEAQLLGMGNIHWAANVVLGVMVGIAVFVLTYLAFYLSFRAAKKRRNTLLDQLEDD